MYYGDFRKFISSVSVQQMENLAEYNNCLTLMRRIVQSGSGQACLLEK